MRRTWPFLLAVVVVGVLTGSLIAGVPEARDPLVIHPASVVDSSSSTSSSAPVPLDTTSTAVATTTEPPPAAGSQPTVEASTTTSVLPTTTTTSDVDRSTLRLVVANADGRSGLATSTASRMTSLGYGRIDLGDSPQNLEFTTIYYRPTFLSAAATVAKDLDIPNVPMLELPADLTTPLTNSDDFGDVIVLLGADAPR